MKFNYKSKFNILFEETINSIGNTLSNEEGWEWLRTLKKSLEDFAADPGDEAPLCNAKKYLPSEPAPIPGWSCLYSKRDYNTLNDKELFIYWSSTCTLLKIKNVFNPRPEDVGQREFAKLSNDLTFNTPVSFGVIYFSICEDIAPESTDHILPELSAEEMQAAILKAAESKQGMDTVLRIEHQLGDLYYYKVNKVNPGYTSKEILKAWYDAAQSAASILQDKKKAEATAKDEEIQKQAAEMEITDEVRAKYFKNYGTMNGWGEAHRNEWKLADALHDRDEKEHPELHKSISWDASGSVHHYGCEKCKFHYDMDSSD
jgi:hypothetical protein